MGWKLPKIPYTRFERNPLEVVIAQIRFHPILRIERDCAGFQDRVRGAFPLFEKTRFRDININLGSGKGATVSERWAYKFESANTAASLMLSVSDMSLTSHRHVRRAEFLAATGTALAALQEEYGPVVGTRLGLRYINRIDLEQIKADLGEELGWGDLVHPEFLQVPRALADLTNTRTYTEVHAPMPRGRLSLRYGLLQEQPNSKAHFRLDTDRYLEEEFDAGQAVDLLEDFAVDIYSVFRAAAGEGLMRWMKPVEEDPRNV